MVNRRYEYHRTSMREEESPGRQHEVVVQCSTIQRKSLGHNMGKADPDWMFDREAEDGLIVQELTIDSQQ